MLKLGIYGDSFADTRYLESLCGNDSLFGKSWVEILCENFDITNYSEGGSGVYFSYVKFLENHKQHDLNLFLISQHSRFSVQMRDIEKIMHVVPGSFQSGYDKELKKLESYPTDKRIFQSIKGYLDHIMDDKKDKTFANLMIDNIKKIRPDTFFIDLFDSENSLVKISILELMKEGLDFDILRKDGYRVDLRKCHLSEENNIMTAEKVAFFINQNIKDIKFDSTDYRPSSRPIISYFLKNIDGPRNL
jgi:hypothetical protein